jgi:ABC-type Mn2+/Zn2+ transport system ATPase subunit
VLLDEPHAALDAEGMALVDRLLNGWRDGGATVLVASHQSDRITAMADGWARLEGGLLAEIGGAGVSLPQPATAAATTEPALLAADR